FGDFAPHVFEFLSGCDLGGFNVLRFDIPFLQNEMTREGIPLELNDFRIVDVQVIFHKKEPRDLSAALRYYCNKDHTGAHDALSDVRATAEILDAQLGKYDDLSPDLEQLHKYCNTQDARWVTQDRKFFWRNNQAVISFGKHKGKSLQWLAEHQADYLAWMSDSDFPPETRELIRNALNGIFPQKPEDED
ncbi:3'-5' exonuclease, partial [candidate division KSB1 bacterium]|nr:3'-5' exonuclease [candidate division KSB1 bacterium]